MNKHISVFCESGAVSVYNVKEVNSSFAVASLDIMYTGKNPNKSDIGRDAVEAALPSLYNVPIVCNWDPDSREIGGHDVEFVRDDDGSVRMRNLTTPCGVVTDHTKFSFQVKEDSNGVEHEYLVADGVLLWKRQDVYSYIVNDLGGVVPHSMEITVTDGFDNKDSGYFEIKKFEFTALCLLGNVNPCFNGSKLEVFSSNDIKEKVEQMFNELKQCYSAIVSAQTADDNINSTHSTKGGSTVHEEVIELAKEFGIDLDSLDFSFDEMSLDEIRAKFEEITAEAHDSQEGEASVDAEADKAPSEEPAVEQDAATEDTAVFELNSNLGERIYRAVGEAGVIHREWGDMQKYFARDYDESKQEVYFESAEDWELYGAKYTMDGDNVVIDFSTMTRKKYAIIDFDEGTATTPNVTASVFSALDVAILGAKEEASDVAAKFEALQAESDGLKAEVEELRKFKEGIEAEAAEKQIDSVFAKFSTLVGVDAFDKLVEDVKSNAVQYDTDTLEEKCYAILGRLGTTAKFSEVHKSQKIVVDKTDDDTVKKPYGGIVEKYLGNK